MVVGPLGQRQMPMSMQRLPPEHCVAELQAKPGLTTSIHRPFLQISLAPSPSPVRVIASQTSPV